MYLLADISNDFNFIINLMKNFIGYCFTWLDSISFNGTTLLRFSITTIVLGAVIEIMFTLVNTRSIKESRPGSKKEKGGKKGD